MHALLKVTITRYITDEPQPGIVECELIDVHGRCWHFIEKTAIVSSTDIDATSHYPRPGVIAGEVVGRSHDAGGREVFRIDTHRPWGVESVDGNTQFEVFPAALVEL